MRVKRFDWGGEVPRALAGEIRTLQPPLAEVGEVVAGIVGEVRDGGDEALRAVEARLGADVAYPSARVPAEAIEAAPSKLDGQLVSALETAAANVRVVAEAQLAGEQELTLEQGQAITLREVAVSAAGVYAPGGTAAYPSTVLMGCVPAKVAGVERVALASPTGTDGLVSDLVLAAAAIAGADEVYGMGGAQAIAALGLGTEEIPPVDVVAGPGNRYVQEAKRQLAGEVGIDGIAGPSELMVIAGDTANPDWIGLDLCSQAEHGADGLLVAAAVETVILDAIEEGTERVAGEAGIAEDAPLALVAVPDTESAVALANAIAPEHLQLMTEDSQLLAGRVRTAGCVFLGEGGATGFGDYAAGSNHILPTGGAGRFQGPLGPGVFRRRVATVEIGKDAAQELAPTVATLARAEGFPLHADSAEARARK